MIFKSIIKVLICSIFLPSLLSCSNGSSNVAGQIKKYENLKKRINKLDDLKNYEKKLTLSNKAKKLRYQLVENIWNNNKIYVYAPGNGMGYSHIDSAIYLGKNNKIYELYRSRKDFRYIGKLDKKVKSNTYPFNSTLLYSLSKSKKIKNAKQICFIQQYFNLKPKKRCLLEKKAFLKMDNLLKASGSKLYKPDVVPYSHSYSAIEMVIINDWEAKNMQTIEDEIPRPFKITSNNGTLIDIRYPKHQAAHQKVVQDFRSKNDKFLKKYPKLWDRINTENAQGMQKNSYESQF